MDWNYIQNLYPINKNMIWLNNCGVSPANTQAIDRVSRFLVDFAEHGIFTKNENLLEIKTKIKRIISRLIKCDENELAIIHNTSEGANFISQGLSLKPGDEILLLEDEYPSNYYPWLHWKDKGVNIKIIPNALNPEEFFTNFLHVVGPQTRLIAISAVHWCTGMPLPLKKIGNYCTEHEIDLFVDGAQGVGLIDLDVKDISFMPFSAWKWLLGPVGLGMLYIKNEKMSSLRPSFVGPGSVDNERDYLPYKNFKDTVDRYEYSTPNFNDWIYFLASLELLDSVTFANAQKRIYELSDYIAKKLLETGFDVVKNNFRELSTGIIAFSHSTTAPNELHAHLQKNDIITALRLERIRISPHMYNTFEQMDEVIAVLKKTI